MSSDRSQDDIGIVMNARVNSVRLPRKMIRPFAGTTLLDIALDKLSKIRHAKKYFAANEPEILSVFSKYEDRGIKLIARSEESTREGVVSYDVAFSHYANIPDRYILLFNGCHPFVNPSVYEDAIDHFVKNVEMKTLTSVVKTYNLFFDDCFTCINNIGCGASSQRNRAVYEMAHVFHIFDRLHFVNTGDFWDYSQGNPAVFPVSRKCSLDIDDELDFQMCEGLYLRLCGG